MAVDLDGRGVGRNVRPAPAWRQQADPDPEAVRLLYVEQAHTEGEIARILGISRELVASTLRQAGVPRRDGTRACPVSVEELRRLHLDEAVPVRTLAEQFNAGDVTVHRWLTEAGITSVPEDLDVAELRRLYVEQELPVREVANRLGCSPTTARRQLVRAGIPRRDRSTKKRSEHRAGITDEVLRELYVERGLSQNDTAAKLGVSVWYLRRRLAEAGLAKRRGTFTPHSDYTRQEMRDRAAELYQGGLTMREVGARLGLEGGTVRQALHEARVPIRKGGLPHNTEGAAPRLLIDELYADPAIDDCLRRHDVLIPGAAGWTPAAPTETLAPLPLAPELVRDLYAAIGLSTLHMALLCGVGMGTVRTALISAGITLRPASESCPWMVKTYGLPPAKPKPGPR